MGHKRLDEELPQNASGVLNLLLLTGSLSNPSLSLGPGLVQGQKTALSSSLDELIGLGDELGVGLEKPRVGDLSLVQDVGNVGIFREVQRGESAGRVVSGRRRKRAGLDNGGAGEMVVEDGLAVGLENRLGGHSEL
jgi:hypothetical protein